MTRIIFSRSIFIGPVSKLMRCSGYRPYRLATLIFLALGLLLPTACGWADDSEDWPEPVYFPQTQEQPAPASAKENKPESNPKPESGKTKKGFWPFRHSEKQGDGKSVTDAQSVKSGPKDPPPSPYPLVRLPMPIQASTGIIGAGIYLIKPADRSTEAESPLLNTGKTLYLTRQNKVMVKLLTHAVTPVDENMALTGTPSPLTKVNPKAPPVLSVDVKVSKDLQSITFIVKEGEQRFESEPFPVATDQRHQLTF